MNVKNIFFDLDGTLVDSSYDIKRILTNALNICGFNADNGVKALRIGPPLEEMIKSFIPDIADDSIAEIVRLYRKEYKADNLDMTTPYKGMVQLLEYLKNTNVDVYIATYKPKHMALPIINRHFSGLYKDIATPTEIENFSTGKNKTDILKLLLSKWNIKAEESVMVGDSRSDIDCAKEAGIYAIAVLYGFGDPAEFTNADEKAATVEELFSKIKGFRLK